MRDELILTLPNGWTVTVVRTGAAREGYDTYDVKAANATKSKEIGFGSHLRAAAVLDRVVEINDRAD